MRPRSELVDLATTPWYHCIQRCVRRAWLCGVDPYTGKSFEHRREWVEERLKLVTSVFAIDLASYAIRSNHVHTLVKIVRERAESWSNDEVRERWLSLYPGTKSRFVQAPKNKRERDQNEKQIEEWRSNLWSLSWFQRAISEPIARRANREDECTGRFWEGRFKSKAILDDAALITCMAYIDLNPIHDGEAQTLAACKHTSARARLDAFQEAKRRAQLSGRPLKTRNASPGHLLTMSLRSQQEARKTPIPLSHGEYVELLEWLVAKKKVCERDVAKPLEDCGIRPESFPEYVRRYDELTAQFVGAPSRIRAEAYRRKTRHLIGARKMAALYRGETDFVTAARSHRN